jgi:hypothetical protein
MRDKINNVIIYIGERAMADIERHTRDRCPLPHLYFQI